MSTETIYTKVNRNRKSWQPISPVSPEYATEGAEDVISRCLALRSLELPVGEFIRDGLSRAEAKDIGKEGIEALERNIEDEIRHDTALNNCVRVYAQYDSSYELEVSNLAKSWIDHPDFPITKAAVLENGVFFVVLPLYRSFGGAALRTTSIDVSADEIGHVRLHRHVAKELNQPPSKSLDKLRKDTVAWFLERFNVPNFKKDSFLKASDDLMYRGITRELDFSQTFQVPAFFERPNSTLPYYT